MELKPICFLTLSQIWMMLLAEPALADACSQVAPSPTAAARIQVLEPTLDFNQGVRAISDNPRNAVPHGLEGFTLALGATSVAVNAKWKLTLSPLPRGDGGLCVGLQHVEMDMSTQTQVAIASEIPRDSCIWKVVVEHERKHVRLDRQLFPKLAQLVEQQARTRLPGAVAAGSMEEGNKLLSDALNRLVVGAVAEFEQQRNRQQLTIDTREEYLRPNRICGDASVAEILGRAGY